MDKIKKYIILFCILCMFIIIPDSRVKAEAEYDDLTESEKGGNSNSCATCRWLYQTGFYGIRIGIYKYNKEEGLKKIGTSHDFVTAKVYDRKGKSFFYVAGKTRLDYQRLSKTDPIFSKQNKELNTTFNKLNTITPGVDELGVTEQNINTLITKYNLVERLKSYIKTNIETLMGKENYEDYKTNYEDYYIVVEPTMLLYSRKEEFKNNETTTIGNRYIYGTVYEIVKTKSTWDDDIYKLKGVSNGGYGIIQSQKSTFIKALASMYISKDPNKIYDEKNEYYDENGFIGDTYDKENGKKPLIVTAKFGIFQCTRDDYSSVCNASIENKKKDKICFSGNYLNKKKDKCDPDKTKLQFYDENTYPYGITVLWMKEIADPSQLCIQQCSKITDNTSLDECVKDYCGKDTECASICKNDTYDSPGCERPYLNRCYNENEKELTSKGNVCASKFTSKQFDKLNSKICYDDVTTIKKDYTLEKKRVIVDKNNNVIIGNYNKELSYYKIECEETVTFDNMPTSSTPYVSSALTATLYYGYTSKYNKTCQIYYKTKNEDWTDDYEKSKIKEEITTYTNYLYEDKYKKDETTKKEIKSIIEELNKIKKEALNQLKEVANKQLNKNYKFINNLELEYSNQTATKTQTVTIPLTPVYCIGNNSITSKKYCDLEEKKGYKIDVDTNNVICTENGENIKALVDDKKGKSTYQEIVYYSVPSSYTGINEMGDTVVFHNKNEIPKKINPVFEIKNAWVFESLNKDISIDKYNQLISDKKNMNLKISGLGTCGQFTFELDCDYKFTSSNVCSKTCIEEYNKPGSQMTEEEYKACFKQNCSCDAYCGSNVACRMQYCPQECDGCEDLSKTEFSCSKGECLDNCKVSYAPGKDRLTCNYNCCRTQCNREVGCIYNCCKSECDAKYKQKYISKEEYKVCLKSCGFETNSGGDYIYRTINLNRPFPDGDNTIGREPGRNWYGKVEYITRSSDATTKYYDHTDGRNSEYEYRFVLTSEKIQQLKNNSDLNLTYTNFHESENARNTYEEATRNKSENTRIKVYCSHIIHNYFKEELGVVATSNSSKVKTDKVVGSGCYTE